MEAVTFLERVKVLDVVEIPSEIQVRQAISKLYIQRRSIQISIKFPFGMVHDDGLKMLLRYHEFKKGSWIGLNVEYTFVRVWD